MSTARCCALKARSKSTEPRQANARIVQGRGVNACLFEVGETTAPVRNAASASSKRYRTSRLMPRLLMASASRNRSAAACGGVEVLIQSLLRLVPASEAQARLTSHDLDVELKIRIIGNGSDDAAASSVSRAGCSWPSGELHLGLEASVWRANRVEGIARRDRRIQIFQRCGNFEFAIATSAAQQSNPPPGYRVRRRCRLTDTP